LGVSLNIHNNNLKFHIYYNLTHKTDKLINNRFDTDYYDAQARRDFFLSGESSNVCINHGLRLIVLVGFLSVIGYAASLASAHPARVLSASLQGLGCRAHASELQLPAG
jgi:hypothetical protein